MFRFRDRYEAGKLMAGFLGEYSGQPNVVVMPVRHRAADVAQGLSAALGAEYVASDAPLEELAALAGAIVILVDDGIDSPGRFREPAMVARSGAAVRVVAAAPIGTAEACHRIGGMVDQCRCLSTPTPFHSVGFWYDDSFRDAATALFVGARYTDQQHGVAASPFT
jgi:predicted phosphoribosyltransferase